MVSCSLGVVELMMGAVRGTVAETMEREICPDPGARISLIENHDEAYSFWRGAAARQRILIHVDAHHDMWWVEPQSPINIANFICRALQEDLVREVYWVVPDRTWESLANRRHLLRHFRKIISGYPGKRSRAQIEPNRISCAVLGKPLHICGLAALPVIEENVLLDIDVDFLIFPRVTYGRSDAHPAMPWCWPEELLARLRERELSSDLITIAYSVEGGFTPLRWKYLGDELARRLKTSDERAPALEGMLRMREGAEFAQRGELAVAEEGYQQAKRLLSASAAPLLHLALLYLSQHRTEEAQQAYGRALELDPSYRTAYNSAGLWQYRNKGSEAARGEFEQILKLDPEDAAACLGLGWLAMREKRWREAEVLLRRALERDAGLLDAQRALGDVLMRKGRHEEALAAYERSLKLALAGHRALASPMAASGEQARLSDPDHWRAYRQLARLCEWKGETRRAIDLYRMSAAGGCDAVRLRGRLIRLYAKQRNRTGAAREAWQAFKLLFVGRRSAGPRLARWLASVVHYAHATWLAR